MSFVSAGPALCSPARACSAWSILLPCRYRCGRCCGFARLFERRTKGAADTRLSAALTRLGPSYVKLGQFLATRPDVVGAAFAKDLERLQDQMPPFPQAQAEAVVAASFGKPVKSVFLSFGPAVAAASIAQVHRGEVETTAGPRAVAIKVLRPDIERRFHTDLAAFTFAAQHAENLSAEARRLRPIEIVETLRRSVMVEMDFRLEAAALSEMAENTKDDPDFRVPAVDWDRTTKEVLTLEWIDATPLSDRAQLAAKGFDLPKLAPHVDPDIPAPRAARRLLSRRHASGQSVRRR